MSAGPVGNKNARMETDEGVELITEGVHFVESGVLRLVSESGGTLELITWKGEPAVVVDGRHVIRRTTLVTSLARSVNEQSQR